MHPTSVKGSRLQNFVSFFRLGNPYLWAIILRVGLLILMKPHPRGDAGDFQVIAHNLAEGHGFSRCWQSPFPPTSQRPPLYPFLLSILYTFEINDVYGPGIFNILIDLLAMKVSERFARAAKLSRPGIFPWIIALCPLLITLGNYPLTESLSVFLFFLASLYLFRGASSLSGFCFGLLALCRSYYLIFPWFMNLLRPFSKASRKSLLIIALFSIAAPSVWIARNVVTLHKPLFSQTGTAAFQSYVGLCRRGFDWWDPQDVQHVSGISPFRELLSAQCMTDDQVLALNNQGWQLVYDCITNDPAGTFVNFLVKTWSLFFEWGQVFPYDYVPKPQRVVIDLIMMAIWARMIWVWLSLRKENPETLKTGPHADMLRYTLINIGYVFLVTIPFGIDARYLLPPALLAFGLTLDVLPNPIDFVREPLKRVFG